MQAETGEVQMQERVVLILEEEVSILLVLQVEGEEDL